MKFLNKLFGRGAEDETQEGSVEQAEMVNPLENSPPSEVSLPPEESLPSEEPLPSEESLSPEGSLPPEQSIDAAAETEVPEPHPLLSLGRACREAGQLRESVGHYQQYLRSFTEAPILEELAEVFEELGEAYMASSSRMIADSLKNKV